MDLQFIRPVHSLATHLHILLRGHVRKVERGLDQIQRASQKSIAEVYLWLQTVITMVVLIISPTLLIRQ